MISWKYSFKRLNEEYEIAKKKKQALDSLYENGRISQATRDSFTSDITAAIAEIEKQQQDLLEKMQTKTREFEEQIKTLESILANYEIQHVIGEIDEEVYQREINLLSTGLESAKHELNTIREAISQLCPPVAEAPTPPEAPEVAEAPQEPASVVCECHTEESVTEAAPAPEPVTETVTENIPIVPEETAVAAEPVEPAMAEPEPVIQEPAVTEELAAPEQPPVENAEIVENVEVAPAETMEAPEIVAPAEVAETAEVTEPAEVIETAEVTEVAEVAEPVAPTATVEAAPETAEMPPTEDVPADETAAVEPAEEAPQVVEEAPQATEEAAPVTEDTTPVVEETPQVTEEQPQIIMENPETIETPAEITPEETASIDEPIPVMEEQSKLIEETPTILEETPIEAHPQKAPGEAQPEVILEPISEETQDTDEAHGVEEASEENVEEEQEV